VPELRGALDYRPHVGHGERDLSQLRRLDVVADLTAATTGSSLGGSEPIVMHGMRA